MNKTKRGTLALIFVTLFAMTIFSNESVASLDYEKAWSNRYSPVEKMESNIWNKIQELKASETTRNESFIIWLSENRVNANKSIEDLKTSAVSLLETKHNANVYRVCKALPVIMATVSLKEIEIIATYDFIDYIYGNEPGYIALDVSKNSIRASSNFEIVGDYNGSGLEIAIIDTGINRFHPDLDDLDDDPGTNDPKVIQEISFVDWNNDSIADFGPMDNYGHGTHVAGIAAGTGESSGYEYIGVAPGAWLWNYKVGEMEYQYWDWNWLRWVWYVRVDPDDVVAAIDHAIIQKPDIINLSLGFRIDRNGADAVSRAADRAVTNGIVVVAAAGNDGPNPQTIRAPGDAFNVITVGAIDDINTPNIQDDNIADFSSRGPTGDGRTKPDVVAPGVNIIAPVDQGSEIWQTWPEFRVGNFYYSGSGTSMAAPHVAGVAALILQAHPNWTPAMVKYAIKETANLNDILQPLNENDRGKGIVDASRALPLGTEIPPDQADSMYVNYWGNAHAIAYLNGTFRIWAAGTAGGDARAEARLNKTFTPSHDMSNTTFFFGFHDVGYMEADLGYAHFFAILKLWQGNTILATTEKLIHDVAGGWAFSANCSHAIQLTYQGKLLAGQQYKLEYGFLTFAKLAWSNFYDTPKNITALHLTAIDTVGVGNPSFEERVGSVYESWYWVNNKAGWRELQGDVDGNGIGDITDMVIVINAMGSYPGHPNWNPNADVNGDLIVDITDYIIVIGDNGKTAKRIDGYYSWYTNGAGDYTLAQWLCNQDVNAMKGKQVKFMFNFWPATVASNGLKNYARAEIYYVTSTGSNQTIYGAWIYPKQTTWYNPQVTTTLPANTIAIKIIIHGNSGLATYFNAWIDKASITIT